MIPRPASVDLDGVAASTAGAGSASSGDKGGGPSAYAHPAYPDLPPTRTKCQSCTHKVRTCLVSCLERFFFRYGKFVARKPIFAGFLCLALAVGAGAGMAKFTKESNGVKLWVSEESSTRINTDWLWSRYPPSARFASMIFEAEEDVLDPDVFRTIYRIRKEIDQIVTEHGDTWRDLCQPLPVVKPPNFGDFFGSVRRKKKKRQSNNQTDEFGFFDEDDSDFDEMSDDGFFDSISAVDEAGNVDPAEKESSMITYAEYLSVATFPEPYCDLVNKTVASYACFETSVLELWANGGEYDRDTDEAMASLTRDQILNKLNGADQVSGIFLVEKNFTEYLAGIKRDPVTGDIIGAKATVVRWLGKMNGTAAKLNPAPERGEPIDPNMLHFEGHMIDVMLNKSGYPNGLKSYPKAHRSFGDVASVTILGDVAQLGIGYCVVFCYVLVMLGRFNCVEHRAWLAVAGVLSVVLGINVAYGACSAMGLFFSPMHNVLPFLLLGVGIDDMFVIVQCWDNIRGEFQAQGRKLPSLADHVGLTVQHAGVAITVTSATDVMAFGVGGSTVLPALRSFCLFAAVGIVAIYFFQLTFFVACLSVDARRAADRRNACCCCFRHSQQWTPNKVSRGSLIESAFSAYARALTCVPCKLLVLTAALAVTGVGVWGNLLLEQKFDPAWFLPPDSYVGKWFAKNREYFPFGGDRVTVYFYGVNYAEDLERVDALVRELEAQEDIVDDVDAWTSKFIHYYNEYFVPTGSPPSARLPALTLNATEFSSRLGQFMFSPRGGRYRERFKFQEEFGCGQVSSTLELSELTFRHKQFSGPKEHIPAMNRVKRILASSNLTASLAPADNGTRVFPLSRGYTQWETDEVIGHELYRNMALALACVAATTLLLLSDLLSSLLVLSSVVLSLVDVAGFMHFWGLTLDTVSACQLVIAIGLTVDYSSHVAHCFMTERGTKNERVVATLTAIGPAVLNGGVSTFLAFILLAGSQSHVFKTFFKIFFLVVVFGLFHGLAVLPVLLSLVGPEPNAGEAILVVDADDDDEYELPETAAVPDKATETAKKSEEPC